ncbi:MAG: cytochrome c [Chloroflexi bacterium]|nr:cytochrome c [Chloroflexota bacterium]
MNGTSQPLGRPSRAGGLGSGKAWVLALASAFVLLGCSRGSYPVDFFSEMHYNQSYKVQEPPSLSAPSDSVPITGRELTYTLVQARGLTNPVPDTSGFVQAGEALYLVNCAACHGAGAKGDGPMRERLAKAGYASRPADLTGTGPIASKTDGEVFQVLTKGFAVTYGLPADRFVMPPFEKLLAENSRWEIIRYLRTLQ